MPDSISAPPQTEPATFSVHQLAKRLGISERTVHRLKDSGALPPPIRLGKLLKWPRKTIEAWLDEQAESARR